MSTGPKLDRVSVAAGLNGEGTRPTSAAFAAAQKRQEDIEQAPPAEERDTASATGPLPSDPYRYMRIKQTLERFGLDNGPEPGSR